MFDRPSIPVNAPRCPRRTPSRSGGSRPGDGSRSPTMPAATRSRPTGRGRESTASPPCGLPPSSRACPASSGWASTLVRRHVLAVLLKVGAQLHVLGARREADLDPLLVHASFRMLEGGGHRRRERLALDRRRLRRAGPACSPTNSIVAEHHRSYFARQREAASVRPSQADAVRLRVGVRLPLPLASTITNCSAPI